MTRQIGKPFWIDTVGRSNFVDIRIKLDNAVMHVIARRSQTYASNSQIFLLWMVGTSLVLLTVAILFLRNQIKPILRLSEAADSFGRGRPPPADFKPRGAREVRQAAHAFIEMRNRIERYVEQRTIMLAGVSHDLRTVLTRFKLQLALFEDSPELEAMRADVDEMQAMLEDYMAFAKGDAGEEIVRTDIGEILSEVKSQAHGGRAIAIEVKEGPLVVPVRRHAFKRAVANLVNNAARFAEHVNVSAAKQNGALTVAGGRRRARHSRSRARACVPPVLPHRSRAQSGFRLDRAWAGHRPRHRPHSRRRHRAQPVPARRPEGCAKSPGLKLQMLGGDISCVDWL